MNMIAGLQQYGEFRNQARVARALGSPFVAKVLTAGERQLFRAPLTARLIAEWPGDPSAAAMAVRFNAALHSLARRGVSDDLTALYRGERDDLDAVIGATMAAHDAFIAEWMLATPQTNEVGRAAVIVAALADVHRMFGTPFELLEIGASCGLNLNLARYAYDLGGVAMGRAGSTVRVAPSWRGPLPGSAPIDIVAARGVDLNPLDAADEATREQLLSYVWADQPARAARLEEALALAVRHPPHVDRGDAPGWLRDRLGEPQRAGACRVVLHSMVFQYLTGSERQAVIDTVRRAGARATTAQPLAWIAFEWTPTRSEVQLSLTCWPFGGTRVLATCHPYGDWVDWRE